MNPRPSCQGPRNKPGGVALIAVLWLISLLTVLALGVLESVRRHGQLAQRSFEVVQLREFADSAIRIRLLELSAPQPGSFAPVSTGRQQAQVWGETIALTLEREAGRVDVNTADADLLMAVFAANGSSEEQASVLAARIIDWRDADDERSQRGAERMDYQQAGRNDGPKNGPFESLSELRRVLGLESLSDELLGAFTVYSHEPAVVEAAAPTTVVRALEWADSRQLGGHRWLKSGSAPTSRDIDPVQLAGELLRITACVKGLHQQQCRMAVIRLTGNAQRPVLVLAWEMGVG